MVITPGIKDLPYTYDDGIKYFTLIAEEIVWELVDGIFVRAWGYNGSTPGPTIRVFLETKYASGLLIIYLKEQVCTGMA